MFLAALAEESRCVGIGLCRANHSVKAVKLTKVFKTVDAFLHISLYVRPAI